MALVCLWQCDNGPLLNLILSGARKVMCERVITPVLHSWVQHWQFFTADTQIPGPFLKGVANHLSTSDAIASGLG